MVRIDLNLKDTFYSVSLPKAIKSVTTFRVRNNTYTFNALPMGFFLSPFLLKIVC